MRSLFILLLLMNLSYLIWGVAFSEKNNIPATAQQLQGKQTITLLSEQPNDLVANPNKQSISKSSKLPKSLEDDKSLSIYCYSLGPMLDEEQSKKLEQKLKQGGFKPKHKAITGTEPKSYWVYFPAEKTIDDARAVANQLQIANVDDYFIILKGEHINAISLGLYNSYDRAKFRVRRLKKLGFNAKIKTRYKQVTRHWLDFQETSAKRLENSVWDKIEIDNPLQKITRPCVDPLPYTS